MIKIAFQKNQVALRQENGIKEIFDGIRKKWLILTPEEWVRQNMVQYLLTQMHYPASLIAVEKEIRLGELKKRCDLVVYHRNTHPWMIVECKEMNVTLSEKTIGQILRYHISLPAIYLVITNGSYTYGFKKEAVAFREISEFPTY